MPFQLFDDLRIDAVTDSAGRPLAFYRPKGSYEVWVRLEPALQRGETRVIRLRYHGELLRRGSLVREILRNYDPSADILQLGQADEWIFLRSPSYWYPRYGVAGGYGMFEAAVFDLTFQSPQKCLFSSIGTLAEERNDGDVRTTRWVTARPEGHAAFNIGTFEEFVVSDHRIPPVTVHMAMESHRQLDQYFFAQRDPKQQVTTDLVNSIAFYTEVFGDPPFESFRATEIPGFYGQAFPGLIHLSWITYLQTSGGGQDETFRAHEMAHQWWGIAVDPLTYRDAWISEGFADFSGLWYMQTALGENKRYFDTLKAWREQIMARRGEAGPIWLGTRLREDYFLTVYRKGAWVLQMLRNMMIDLRTMDETPFKTMMRDFYQEYRGRRASTADFQAVVERHTGVSMEWFFDQWVRRSEIPTYVASWTAEPTGGGRHQVRLRIRQEDVPEDFKMYVPVLLDFGETGSATLRVFVSGPRTEVTLPPVDASPRDIVVNPLESVLANVRTEGWR